MLIRQGIREICGLPADTPIPVFYYGRKVRDLSMLRTFWEASLQHLAIAKKLSRINYQHLKAVLDLPDEIAKYRLLLDNEIGNIAQAIRSELRVGGLSSGEWTNVIKASINSMSNHGAGGRSVNGSRHFRNEVCNENNIVEFLLHIRGACPKTKLQRNAAHHRVRSAIADLIRNKNFEAYEEIHCQTMNNSVDQNRRTDIIVLDGIKKPWTHLRPNNSLGNK
ncbi:Hypothetical protein CINCED_3A021212 [Cinara cedri]|uniref:Uncharacterized protein n=1 Tax=Cinara cedri TaxID=506608 RepID=A0A5E4MFF4_9HEMI|nr:Hypothetical protein CINCED_3A021212 [Cinara cedri]